MNGKQLKNSILQWAIQGKLVPQDPNDEPASVLLERIRAEKVKLVKEKKIKKDKNESIIYRGDDNSYYEKIVATGEVKCIDEEIPFEIPQGWEWCRLRNLISTTDAGKSPNCDKRPKKENEWGVLTTTAIQNCRFLPEENKVLPSTFVVSKTMAVVYEDILITRAGPKNRTAVACVVDTEVNELILSDKTVRINHLRGFVNPYYLAYVINSPIIREAIMAFTVGMAASQVNISQGNIQSILIPLPPKKEQYKIVSKLRGISPVVEHYNKTQDELNTLNLEIREFLKKSILQEAIQGKLVSQIPEEGTAEELLANIRKEKELLVKEGKLKKSALSDSIIYKGDDNKYFEKIGKVVTEVTDEIPFEIPDTWQWVRVKDIFQINPKNIAEDNCISAFIPMEKICATYGSEFSYDEVQWKAIKTGYTHFADGDVAFAKITPCFQNRKSAIFCNSSTSYSTCGFASII